MSLSCGIVGLPNVGKSTLFNALTKAGIEAQNFPFCTIEPNVGVVPVPDARLQTIADIVKPQQTVPTSMKFVDIAGLVKGAAQGEGLGNQFLANIRETQAIAHVVRCFDNDDITHVSGQVDPISDIEVINTELALADLEVVEKMRLKNQKKAKSGDKEAQAVSDLLAKIQTALEQGQPVRAVTFTDNEQQLLKQWQFLTAKPVLYIANVDEDSLDGNEYVKAVQALADQEGAKVVVISAAIEAEIIELDDSEQQEFLESVGLSEPGLNRVIQAGYELLGLQTYFTAGVKEVRAWTIKQGASAPEAAAAIHTDFQKGFIRAEVMAYDDFVAYKGEQGAKDAGKWRLEGKEYVMQDGDVVTFRFNV